MNDAINHDELEVLFGSTIKDLGNGRIGGYAVLFTTSSDPDLTGDFFTKETDFNLEVSKRVPVYYAHTLDPEIKDTKLGVGELEEKAAGLWVEAQLELRNAYERKIYQMVKNGELGFSTGSAPHLIRREKVGSAKHLKSWPIIELSLTPSPAEPRTLALPIKSLEIVNVTDDLLKSAVAPKSVQHSSMSSETLFSEQLTCSLKDHFDICLLTVQVLTNRLNDLKQLRENQGRRSPLSDENLERVKALHEEIKSLIDTVETALHLQGDSHKELEAKQQLIDDLFSDAAELLSYEP